MLKTELGVQVEAGHQFAPLVEASELEIDEVAEDVFVEGEAGVDFRDLLLEERLQLHFGFLGETVEEAHAEDPNHAVREANPIHLVVVQRAQFL